MAALLVPTAAGAARPPQDTPQAVTNVSARELENLRPTDIASILKFHNDLRAQVGQPPVVWDPAKAARAAEWAKTMALTGRMAHSPREGRQGERENLALGHRGASSITRLLQTWGDEQRLFRAGIFPSVCSGDWSTCAHYTQMIWPTTTQIGCGYYSGPQYDALVCRYSPPGNRDGDFVGMRPLQIVQGPPPAPKPPVTATPVPTPASTPPPPPPAPLCSVPAPDDLAQLIASAARQSGFAPDSTDPRDAPTERQWDLALQREQEVQNKLVSELAAVQGNVATNINAYLTAAAAWQERYVYIASTTTGLQGLLTDWQQSRAIYEKADLAFSLANLGVGAGRLGFKGYKLLMARRAAAAAPESTGALATAATVIERAPGSALANSRAETVIDRGARAIRDTQRGGDVSQAATVTGNLAQGARTGAAVADLDPNLVKIAQAEGVNVQAVASAAYDARAADAALMHAIATARGWHDLPKWAGNPLTNLLIQARKVLGGVGGAKISPQDLELLRSLRTYVQSRGLNFREYLRTAAGAETSATFAQAGRPTAGELLDAMETDAIVRYFDDVDVDLLLKILDSGGDATALRNAVSPVTQASMNGLARGQAAAAAASQAAGRPRPLAGAPGSALNAACTGDTIVTLDRVVRGPTPMSTPNARPSDAQLTNVLEGTGQLGQVGLGNVVDQFGITDRFTAGQSFRRAVLGELWELVTSPSATVASYYYTNEAQKQYLDLLQNERGKLMDLGARLNEASRALGDLQQTLQRAGLSGSGSYLGSRGPNDLRRALDDLQRVYDSGSADWKRGHKNEMDERRQHITQKLANLAETVADLNALASRMGQVRQWLDSLRKNPDGSLRGPVELFNPLTFVRLGSISLYLRGMGADAFGLTNDAPFRVAVPQPQQRPAGESAEDWDKMRERARAQAASFDAAPEVAVDPQLDAWLNGLDGGR